MQKLIIISAVIVLVWAMFSHFDNVDDKLMSTGVAYQKCVLELYGVTPSEYLSMKGVMPECE